MYGSHSHYVQLNLSENIIYYSAETVGYLLFVLTLCRPTDEFV
jgi:hypothetical protein